MGIVARNLEPDQLRRLSDAVDDPEVFGRVLANASLWDETVEGGFSKLARGGFKNDDLAALLTRHVDQPQVLDDLLGVVDESAFASWTPRHTEGLSRLLVRSGGLSADAIKHMPFNALDEAFYPGFGNFLESTSDYLPDHLRAINDAAEAGDSSAVLGHLSNILGEYRETRFFQHAVDDLGHQRVFSHLDEFGNVNAPGLDGITLLEDEGVYFLAEVKDRGRAYGTILDGPKVGSGIQPSELKNYMSRISGNNFEFNQQYFLDQVAELSGSGAISPAEGQALIDAFREGKISVILYAGGNPEPLGRTLERLTTLIHPRGADAINFLAIH